MGVNKRTIRAEPLEAQSKDCEDVTNPDNLQQQLHKTKLCVYYMKGACHYGSACAFAHSGAEVRATPNLRKTRLCKAFTEGGCSNKTCSFAHGEGELVQTELFYKKTLCMWNEKGRCRNGDKCRFAHGRAELRTSQAANTKDADTSSTCAGSRRTSTGSRGESSASSDVETFGRRRSDGSSAESTASSLGSEGPPGLPQLCHESESAANQALLRLPMKIRPVLSSTAEAGCPGLDEPPQILALASLVPAAVAAPATPPGDWQTGYLAQWGGSPAEAVVDACERLEMQTELEMLQSHLSAITMQCNKIEEKIEVGAGAARPAAPGGAAIACAPPGLGVYGYVGANMGVPFA